MSGAARRRFVVAGGGLGGALVAVNLGQAGHEVTLYERRPDPRKSGKTQGRSINLAISTRGITALARVGLADRVLAVAVPMQGRMIHAADGRLTFQRYGTEVGQAIHSVSRAGLNRVLVEAAEELPGVGVRFGKRCVAADLDAASIDLEDVETGERATARADAVIGADGAFSVVRREMQKLDRYDYSQSYLGHGYKELVIPAGPGGSFLLEPNALHIWPRGGFMMIALPNRDGSFTCTCFWAWDGPNSFSALKTEDDVRRYFGATFPDALPLMPTLADDYFNNPTGSLVTVRCRPWRHLGKVALLGDAAHAVVPFYGQGANAAFEDCTVLAERIEARQGDLDAAFAEYEALRKANTDALADLAVENFVEMRDHTASRLFHLRKHMEKALHRLLPWWYLPLYSMVSFSTIPYAQARRRAARQDRIVRIVAGVAAMLAAVLLWAATAR